MSPYRVYYDFEFLEDGKTIDWISVGMTDDLGNELYLVNRKLCYTSSELHQRVTRHPWLMANVVRHLPLATPARPVADWMVDPDHPSVMGTGEAARALHDWLTVGAAEHGDLELWAWYGAYDHVRLAQMWGRMADLPRGIPWHTNDIMTLRALGSPSARVTEPKQEGGSEHNALADARHNRRLFHHYMGALELKGYRA